MDLRETLFEGFRYDLWANRQWAASIGSFKDMLRAQHVLEHILKAQKNWLTRCGVEVVEPIDNVALGDLFEHYSGAWEMLLAELPLDHRVSYRTIAGQPQTSSLGQIARHVINHGTYHRGHLRGLAEAEGVEDFPESDLILWFREREPSAGQ